MPTYIMLLASRSSASGFKMDDVLFAMALFDAVLVSFFADQQQWGESD